MATDENAIAREAQLAVRQEIDRRNIPLKLIASKADVPLSTLLDWFPAGKEPKIMSLANFGKLTRAIPADVLSLLLPDGFALVRVPEHFDHDEIADSFAAYLHEKNAAHHPESEAGRDLGQKETERLNSCVVQLPIKGRVPA